jgi:DNA mismatch repair protein MutL
MPDSLHARPVIRRLPPEIVNRIAAGEVVERPAAAIKELVENALDAGAQNIAIAVEGAGLGRIVVEDDGCGLAPEELALALDRHATSKLRPDAQGRVDLLNIQTMGFRGEALPSIASVSRMRIVSRAAGEEAAEILSEAGRIEGPRPAAFTGRTGSGTRIEVNDLFFATPARLKFMRGERAEMLAITDTVKRLAMANPQVAFSLESGARQILRYPAEPPGEAGRLKRLGAIMGREFSDNAAPLDATRDGARLSGFAGLPTLNRGNAAMQFLFVNNRPVKDRMLTGVIRAAYQDFLARDRHPMVALFLDLDAEGVDVNVHPAKTEVRFRDAGFVRGLMIGALRHALAEAGHRASTNVASAALAAARPEPVVTGLLWQRPSNRPAMPPPRHVSEASAPYEAGPLPEPASRMEPHAHGDDTPAFPLGAARAQLHETYVIAQTADGIIIVDQHAAHERLVYEAMKRQMAAGGVTRQALLIPDIVELSEDEAARLAERAGELAELGLDIEPFGPGAVCVRATPALFGEMDTAGLLKDIADDLAEYESGLALKERFEEVMGNMACRSAIRAGRRLTGDEMNALLRQMEATPHSGQCNHGRPTYVELKLADIERLFGRRG